MAYPYGTGSGVTGMKKTGRSNTDIHTFIKAGLVILLVVYLTLLYTADNAKNIPIEQITASMESNETITSLNKEERTDLKHYYQVDERDIDGYFFYKAASPMAVEEICIMKAKNSGQAATLLESVRSRRCQLAQCFPRPDITTRLENMNYGI